MVFGILKSLAELIVLIRSLTSAQTKLDRVGSSLSQFVSGDEAFTVVWNNFRSDSAASCFLIESILNMCSD